MIISRVVYDNLQLHLVTAQAEARAFQETNKGLQVTLDWLRTRVTQMEKERAILIERMFGVKIPVPEIVTAPDPFKDHPYNDMASMFNGMTDEEALKAGIEHNEKGELSYTK
jgi:hypothetical protein